MDNNTRHYLESLNAFSRKKVEDQLPGVQALAKRLLGKDVDATYIHKSHFTTIKTTGSEEKGMFYACTATAKKADLANDVVDPKGCLKYLPGGFQLNPVTLWQHDHSSPIGHSKEFEVGEDSVEVTKALITDMPFNRDVTWPLMSDGSLRGISIGFYGLDGEIIENGLFMFTDWYWFEKSIVSVPCLPVALIREVFSENKAATVDESIMKEIQMVRDDMYQTLNGQLQGDIKALLNKYFDPMEGVVEAYKQNQTSKIIKISIPDAIDAPAVDETPQEEVKTIPATIPSQELTPMKKNMPTSVADNLKLTPEEKAHVSVSKSHVHYESLSEATHLIKCVDEKGEVVNYQYRVGYATSKGFQYDFDLVKTAVCRFLGARAGDTHSKDVRKGVFERLGDIYLALDKTCPTFDDVPLNYLSEKALEAVTFKEVTFYHEESIAFEAKEYERSINEIITLSTKTADNPALLKHIDPALVEKGLRAYFDIWGIVETSEDVTKMSQIMAILNPPDPEDESEAIASIYNALTAKTAEESEDGEEAEGEGTEDEGSEEAPVEAETPSEEAESEEEEVEEEEEESTPDETPAEEDLSEEAE